MVAATLRYWISNSLFSQHIRISYAGGTSMGRIEGDRVRWDYDRPADDIAELAELCATSAGEWPVAGATYEGSETLAEMADAVECTCVGCGARAACADELSTVGACSRCWVAQMAVAS